MSQPASKSCSLCFYYLPYPHQYQDADYDGLCRFDPHFEHRRDSHWCGKFKSSKKSTAKVKVFKKPTLVEVKEYIVQRRNKVNAQEWMDHYQSKGWMIGSGKMKDWKAAVRTWEKSDEKTSSKACVDCGTDWNDSFKFTTNNRGKKVYRCDSCNEKRNKSKRI